MIWFSILGVVALIGLARAFGFASDARLADAAQARELARAALSGFRPGDAALGADGRAALVRGADGRLALVRAHGDRFVVRALDGAALTRDGDAVTVRLTEPMFGPVTLTLADAARWA